jgi:hypothetical protein
MNANRTIILNLIKFFASPYDKQVVFLPREIPELDFESSTGSLRTKLPLQIMLIQMLDWIVKFPTVNEFDKFDKYLNRIMDLSTIIYDLTSCNYQNLNWETEVLEENIFYDLLRLSCTEFLNVYNIRPDELDITFDDFIYCI